MNNTGNHESAHSGLLVVLKASPRANSNSSLLADELAAGTRDAGGEVKTFSLRGMDIRPCDGCDACQGFSANGCVIDDDMQLIYPVIKQASAVVLATPVYWFTFSAQLKLVVDRFYALDSPEGHGLKGKSMVLLMAYGDIDPYIAGAVNAIHTFEDMCRYTGSPVAGILYGSASGPGEMAANIKLLEKARILGKKLVSG
jgi:multimeric flavodoxin WrbA